ncbi:hypothetical protein KJ866_03290 [Patescibacteria group bacterium]|nr:hypothetical protein [Patescibacteria group bacterium]MBU2219903.1 hypothetical protein [Patescibacteria group bacterium]MBU2265200.1 hypothetical protein [Patescibacteria group bacterium]
MPKDKQKNIFSVIPAPSVIPVKTGIQAQNSEPGSRVVARDDKQEVSVRHDMADSAFYYGSVFRVRAERVGGGDIQ